MQNFLLFLKKWALLFVILLALILFYYFDLYRFLDLQNIQSYHIYIAEWTRTHYQLAVTLYIVVFTVLVACGIPCATILTLLGGFLFDFSGFIYAVAGTTIGGLILFLAVRTSIGESIANRSKSWIKRMEAGFQKNAFYYLLMLRLIPIFPCGISNVAAGTLNVPVKTYLGATILGISPATLIYIMVGRGLDKIFSATSTPNLQTLLLKPAYLIPLLGLALLSIFPLVFDRLNFRKKQ